MKFHIDVFQWNVVSGWIFAPGRRYLIEVWRGADCVATAQADRPRPDVAASYPGEDAARAAGFRAPLSLAEEDREFTLRVTACEIDADGVRVGDPVEIAAKRVIGPKAVRASFMSQEGDDAAVALSAFPRGVEAAVIRMWPDMKPAGADPAAQGAMAAKVREVFAGMARLAAPRRLTAYARFLNAIEAHFQFVAQYFPSLNEGRGVGEKDHCATPNSAREMLSVAHHLYVLKSYGVAGDFAEFGCFKGFSSSMLSYACGLLGVRMHIFDSFAGLPASQSKYYKAGDFRGSLDEVRRNISQFGDVGCVEFHEGYFSDTVPKLHGDFGRLATLWMDVDLYDSARDVLAMLDRLDSRGAVFSHDCVAGEDVFGRDCALREGMAARAANSDDVLAAILEAYARAAIVPAGRHISGTTSAFWSRTSGAPALDSAALMELVGPV